MHRPGDIVSHPIGGVDYGFRVPDLYDPARARRILTRQQVRRPSHDEFRLAAQRGIEEIARQAGEEEEGARQSELLARWYELLKPVDENKIDEPDPMKRGEELLARENARARELGELLPDVQAVEATLERHWPPYAELKADREYWDDVSRIEIVRLLLRTRDGMPLELDEDGLLAPQAYAGLDRSHRMPLASHAFRLISPDEAQRKN